MKRDNIKIHNVEIRKNHCTCLPVTIKLKVLNQYIYTDVFESKLMLTEDKIFNLINDYGIKEITENKNNCEYKKVYHLFIDTLEIEYSIELNSYYQKSEVHFK